MDFSSLTEFLPISQNTPKNTFSIHESGWGLFPVLCWNAISFGYFPEISNPIHV